MHGSVDEVLAGEARYHVAECRAEALLDSLPDGCVNMIATDPPYHRVKMKEAWDREHATADGFLGWTGEMLDRYRRVLAPNGSLYVFASPRMAWGVEGEVRKRFEVIGSVTWAKPMDHPVGDPRATAYRARDSEALRTYFNYSERVIFAEQRGSDMTAMGAAGYESQCEAAKRSAFGDYLRTEMARAGVNGKTVAALFPSRTGGLTGCVSNWLLGLNCPTPEQYNAIRELLNATGGEFLRREYEDLRREYEDLRREYEDLRRPFTVSASVPYTDVWDYPTVQSYPGKHGCEKPWAMGLDIVNASSRVNDVVLDCFSGSGTFPAAAVARGRRAIACDMDPHWAGKTLERCARALDMPEGAATNSEVASAQRAAAPKAAKKKPGQLDMFAAA